MNIIFKGWHGYCFALHTRVIYKKIEKVFYRFFFLDG
jgi:hypothetical protein